MGEYYQVIVDVEVDEAGATALATDIVGWLVETGVVDGATAARLLGDRAGRAADPFTDGLEVVTGRTVFHPMDFETVTCPHCGHVTDLHGAGWDDISTTIGEWHEGGSGIRPCWHCRRPVGLNDWIWSPPWGFGNLGLRFWNCPPLDPAFIAAVTARLGHRTVVPSGKI